MSIVTKLRRIFDRGTKIRFAILLAAIIIGALLETLALSLISPFVSILLDNSMIQSNHYVKVIYEFFGFSHTGSFLALLAFLLALIYIVRGIYLYVLSKVQYRFIASRRVGLSDRLLKKILGFSYLYHSGRNIAESQRIILTDVEYMFSMIAGLLLLLSDFFMSFFILMFLLIVSFPMTLCVLALALVCVLVYFKSFRRQLKEAGDVSRDKYIEMTKSVNQALGGIKEVKVLRREAYFQRVFKDCSDAFIQAYTRYQVINSLPKLVIESVCFGGAFILVGIFIMFGTDIAGIVPQLSLFVLAAFRLLPAVSRQVNHVNTVIYHRSSVDAVYKSLFEEDDENCPPIPPADLAGDEKSRDILIDGVTFQYPRAPNSILEYASLAIPYRKSVALVGQSGVGKTTLADLILGILTPQEGTVFYNGSSIHRNFDEWCKNVGYIPQQIYLLDESIRENVAFGIGMEEIIEDKVWMALEQAQLREFVESLPDKLDTVVGDRGIRLSGGQRQRIGIARAIYGDPPILVLDEATSSLDNETEKAVMDAVMGFQGNKTIIIVAHRLSTIEHCDIVYRIEDKVVTREK